MTREQQKAAFNKRASEVIQKAIEKLPPPVFKPIEVRDEDYQERVDFVLSTGEQP